MKLHLQSILENTNSEAGIYACEFEGFVFNKFDNNSIIKCYKLMSRPTSRNRKWQLVKVKKENLRFLCDWGTSFMETMNKVYNIINERSK